MSDSPFHIGEQTVQASLGVLEEMEPWGRKIIRDYFPEQHREFYTQLPFIVAAARDDAGRPWATLLTGPPGFIRSPDEYSLSIEALPHPADALSASFRPGADIGFLGIELETRRRNRVNGRLSATGDGSFSFVAGQTFGNCPQYITERAWYQVPFDPAAVSSRRLQTLDERMQGWIREADTFFIASGYDGDGESHETFGMDASHRGGAPGFVEILDERRIRFPDYAGNRHFNTIGNLMMDERVGLLFIDFDNGHLLQLTGRANVDFESGEIGRYPGAQRLVTIDIEDINLLEHVLPLRFAAPGGSLRSLKVARRKQESDDVVSFELVSRDGSELPDFEPGQYLPIEVDIEGVKSKRTYSLSSAPGQRHYRISVKRQAGGRVSGFLHERLAAGDVLPARPPAGEFVLQSGDRPVVLISAGIGITPLLSMLHRLAAGNGDRPVVFLHGARDGAHFAHADEVRRIAREHPNVQVDIAFSRPRAADIEGRDYDRKGRLPAALVEELASGLDADFYLCGPTAFMLEMTQAIEAMGVSAQRIHTETFGPSSV